VAVASAGPYASLHSPWLRASYRCLNPLLPSSRLSFFQVGPIALNPEDISSPCPQLNTVLYRNAFINRGLLQYISSSICLRYVVFFPLAVSLSLVVLKVLY